MSYLVDTDDVITLRIRSQAGDDTYFKLRKATKMQKVFAGYASKKGLAEHSLRFRYGLEWISPQTTVEMLQLDDNDVIEVFSENDVKSADMDSNGNSKHLSSPENVMESMKAAILNELEENLNSTLPVQTQSIPVIYYCLSLYFLLLYIFL